VKTRHNDIELEFRCARVMCNSQDDYISFEVTGPVSGICILTSDISVAAFGALIAGSGRIRPKGSLRGLDKIGKKCVREQRQLEVEDMGYRQEVYFQWLQNIYKEDGWSVVAYMGGRGQIGLANNGKRIINFWVVKYV